MNPVYDMKEIQGNINTLDFSDKYAIQQKAKVDYYKACEAWEAEKREDHKDAIKIWREICGNYFPTYG